MPSQLRFELIEGGSRLGGGFLKLISLILLCASFSLNAQAWEKPPGSLMSDTPVDFSTEAMFDLMTNPWIGPMLDPSGGYPQICPTTDVVAGLDVSNHQPSTSWDQVHQTGRSFTYIKATEGVTWQNPEFQKDWPLSKTVGMIRGAYHYFRPEDDSVQQADAYLKTLVGLEVDDMPPMLDIEVTDNVAPEIIVENARTWLDYVEKVTGKTPIVYTYPYYWSTLGPAPGFDHYPLFIADYKDKCPQVPTPWTAWTIWQHGIGTIFGVHGKVDLDDFNGGVQDLENFATAHNKN
jgi:GH25 family lysozyme M1 (1,4-beta-N-acetylmuramidase)